MQPEIIVGVLSLFGTLIGSIGGIMTANKLTGYRIEQVEKKLDSYSQNQNELMHRVIKLEDTNTLLLEKISVANHRIDDLEKGKA
jgi:cell division protein FtsB